MKHFFRLLFILAVWAPSTVAQARDGDILRFYKHCFAQRKQLHNRDSVVCDYKAFRLALEGYTTLLDSGLLRNERYLTIIDYTQYSDRRRLFVLDMKQQRLVLASTASHGIGSDPDSTGIPQTFSNRDGSHATSLGFYITGNTYNNHRKKDSVGLCLFGLDSGYNDAAAAREIVFHYGASDRTSEAYVTDTAAGRSYGCPALPLSTNTKIIELIKGGSCLFIYSAKDASYPLRSTVLNDRLRLPVIQEGPPPNSCRCDIDNKTSR